MNVKLLESFVWVARLRNFRLAAERLGATQPTISMRIASLESQLGTKLLVRNARDVHLTQQGLEVLRHAETIVAQTHELVKRTRDIEAFHGTLRLGVIDTIIHSWLIDLLESIQEMYPEAMVEIYADTSFNLTQQLRAGEIDLALIMGPVNDGGLVNVDLCSYAMAWVSSPKLYSNPSEMDVADLATRPIISYPRGSIPYAVIEDYFRGPDFPKVRLNCSNSLATIIRLAIDGLGVAAIPPVLIQREITEGRLSVLPVRQTFPALSFTATYHTDPENGVISAVAAIARSSAHRYCQSVDPDLAQQR